MSDRPTFRANLVRVPVVRLHARLVPAFLFALAAVWGAVLGYAAMTVMALIVAGLVLRSWFVARGGRPRTTASDAPAYELLAKDGAILARRGSKLLRTRPGQIRSGYVVPGRQGARVVLAGRYGPILDAWLPELDEARALLDELGLSPLTKPMTFAFFFGLRVTVGADGVLVAWPLLRRKRFIPHDAIADVEADQERIRLRLKDGSSYQIMTGGRPEQVDDHNALFERLIAVRQAFRAADPEDQLMALGRGGRTLDAWVHDLHALSRDGGSGYRSAAVPIETLWRVALDPAETAELRIGASLALRPRIDDEGRERLRVAADAAASPRIRVGLRAAAEEEDETSLVEALRARA